MNLNVLITLFNWRLLWGHSIASGFWEYAVKDGCPERGCCPFVTRVHNIVWNGNAGTLACLVSHVVGILVLASCQSAHPETFHVQYWFLYYTPTWLMQHFFDHPEGLIDQRQQMAWFNRE